MRARKLTSTLAERVSDTPHRVDEPRRVAFLGLPTQVADVDVERVRRRAEVVSPHALEDDRARQNLTRVPEEQLEQRELGAREIDGDVAAPHLTRSEVEVEVGETEHVGRLVAVASTP